MSTTDEQGQSGEGEGAKAAHVSDRAPTEQEAAAAERAAESVDVADVAAHEKEMGEIGANVKGEGQV